MFKTLCVAFCIVFPIVVISQFVDIFLFIVFSIALTFVLYPFVDFFEKLGMSRFKSTLIIFFLLLFIVFCINYFFVSILFEQIEVVSTRFQKISFEEQITKFQIFIKSHFESIEVNDLGTKVNTFVKSNVERIQQQFSTTYTFIPFLFIIPIFLFFSIKEFHTLKKKILAASPNKYYEMTQNIFFNIENVITKYISGIFFQSIIIMVLTSFGLFLCGVEYAILLGFISGIFNIVPLLGNFISLFLPIIVTLAQFQNAKYIIGPIIVYIIVRIVDSNIIRSRLYNKVLKINPVLVLILIAIGNEWLGMIGTILIIPIYTIIRTTVTAAHWGFSNYHITK